MDGAQRATARLVARNHTTDVRFLEDPQMKCFLGGQKGWTHKDQSAMADVSLAAMAGVTAADHRMSEYREKLSGCGSFTRLGMMTTYHQSAPPEAAASRIVYLPKFWEIHFICLLMGVIASAARGRRLTYG